MSERTATSALSGLILLWLTGSVDAIDGCPRNFSNEKYTVDSILDSVDSRPGDGVCTDADGLCTLRAAVMEANARSGPDLIVLPDGILAKVKVDTDPTTGDDTGSEDDLDVHEDLSIVATGPPLQSRVSVYLISARHFEVHGGAALCLENLWMHSGKGVARGGSVKVTDGKLFVHDAKFSHNNAYAGGAIYVEPGMHAEIYETLLQMNGAQSMGGAIYHHGFGLKVSSSMFFANTAQTYGGAILSSYLSTSTEIVESTFDENCGAVGGAIASAGPTGITASEFDHNGTRPLLTCQAFFGGALWHTGPGLRIAGSTFTDNRAVMGAGLVLLRSDAGIDETQVRYNDATHLGGGALVMGGDLDVRGSTINSNTAAGWGGGVFVDGVYAPAIARFADSEIAYNRAIEGGGLYASVRANVTLRNAALASNIALGSGGGIFQSAFSTVHVVNSVLRDNKAPGAGGAPQHEHGRGGAIFSDGNLVIRTSELVGNQGRTGGAIHSEQDLEIVSSTLRDNDAFRRGGAVYLNRARGLIFASTLSANDAGKMGNQFAAAKAFGGAIYLQEANLQLTNATVSGNRAWSGPGGGIYSDAASEAYIASSTITDNQASTDGGGLSIASRSPAAYNLQNTLLAGNHAAVGNDCFSPAPFGTPSPYQSFGFNLLGDAHYCELFPLHPALDIWGNSASGGVLNPGLGELLDNGGPTRTHALEDSRAIDAGNFGGCRDGWPLGSALLSDQRGIAFARHADGNDDGVTRCDIGAYEFDAEIPHPPPPL